VVVSEAYTLTRLIFRFATVSGQRIDWQLARNGVAERDRMWLGALLLAMVLFFWMAGDRWHMPLGWLAAVAAVAVFVRYGRHAADGDRIWLQGSRLVVERETAGRLERAEFDRSRVRVEPKTGDRSLITLSAQGRSVEVGRFVHPELRPALASEIRMALRAA
jgi:uncharacterized membrane protein